jgi:hypothetical protein
MHKPTIWMGIGLSMGAFGCEAGHSTANQRHEATATWTAHGRSEASDARAHWQTGVEWLPVATSREMHAQDGLCGASADTAALAFRAPTRLTLVRGDGRAQELAPFANLPLPSGLVPRAMDAFVQHGRIVAFRTLLDESTDEPVLEQAVVLDASGRVLAWDDDPDSVDVTVISESLVQLETAQRNLLVADDGIVHVPARLHLDAASERDGTLLAHQGSGRGLKRGFFELSTLNFRPLVGPVLGLPSFSQGRYLYLSARAEGLVLASEGADDARDLLRVSRPTARFFLHRNWVILLEEDARLLVSSLDGATHYEWLIPGALQHEPLEAVAAGDFLVVYGPTQHEGLARLHLPDGQLTPIHTRGRAVLDGENCNPLPMVLEDGRVALSLRDGDDAGLYISQASSLSRFAPLGQSYDEALTLSTAESGGTIYLTQIAFTNDGCSELEPWKARIATTSARQLHQLLRRDLAVSFLADGTFAPSMHPNGSCVVAQYPRGLVAINMLRGEEIVLSADPKADFVGFLR